MITPVLRVRDIDVSLAFYTRILGFQEQARLPGLDGSTAYAEAYLGDGRIMFSRRCDPLLFTSGVELYLVLPDERDLEQFYANLKAREVCIVDGLHAELWGDRAFSIIDLDGNRLTFAQAMHYPATINALAYEEIA